MTGEDDVTARPPEADPGKKSKSGKKDKKGKSKGGPVFSVAGHPRAAAGVRRAKGIGGLVGFAIAALLAHHAGLSIHGTLERALLGGLGGYVIAWGCSVTVWRQILMTQMRSLAAARAGSRPLPRTLAPTVTGAGAGGGATAPEDSAR